MASIFCGISQYDARVAPTKHDTFDFLIEYFGHIPLTSTRDIVVVCLATLRNRLIKLKVAGKVILEYKCMVLSLRMSQTLDRSGSRMLGSTVCPIDRGKTVY